MLNVTTGRTVVNEDREQPPWLILRPATASLLLANCAFLVAVGINIRLCHLGFSFPVFIQLISFFSQSKLWLHSSSPYIDGSFLNCCGKSERSSKIFLGFLCLKNETASPVNLTCYLKAQGTLARWRLRLWWKYALALAERC